MLDKIRKQSASMGAKVIFGLLALVFIFWAGGSSFGGDQYAAKVNGQTIPMQDFEQRYRSQVDARRQRSPNRQIDAAQEKFIKRTVFDGMIETELLVQDARKHGFVVTAQETHNTILEIPDSQGRPLFKTEDGEAVSEEKYREILTNVGLTTDQFERRIERALLKEKMEGFIRNSVKVTDSEVWDEYRIRKDRVNLEFVRLTPATLGSLVTVDETEVTDWQAANTETIQEDYDEHFADLYLEPQNATIRRITIYKADKPLPRPGQPAEDADPEKVKEVQARAQQALAAAEADFVAAAKSFAEGPDWEKSGDTRTFIERQLEGPVATQVFSMKADTPPAMVETSTAYVIIKVVERQEEKVTPLEEVSLEIARKLLKEEKGKVFADTFIKNALEKLAVGVPMAEVIKVTSLEVRETGWFTRQREPTAIGGQAEGFMEAAFSLTPERRVLRVGGTAPMIRDAYVVAVLKERERASKESFEKDKESLEFSVRLRKQGAAYRSWRAQAQENADIKPNKNLNLGS